MLRTQTQPTRQDIVNIRHWYWLEKQFCILVDGGRWLRCNHDVRHEGKEEWVSNTNGRLLCSSDDWHTQICVQKRRESRSTRRGCTVVLLLYIFDGWDISRVILAYRRPTVGSVAGARSKPDRYYSGAAGWVIRFLNSDDDFAMASVVQLLRIVVLMRQAQRLLQLQPKCGTFAFLSCQCSYFALGVFECMRFVC